MDKQSKSMLKLSIIICSYNRASALKLVLDDLQTQYSKLTKTRKNIEILLIDNNSKDETKTLPSRYQDLQIRYSLETNQGLSFARNRGIKEAQGQMIVFIDDDIRLDDNWLDEVYKLSETISPQDLVAYGARVIPQWEAPIPQWLKLKGPYAITQSVFPGHDYGEEIQTYPFVYDQFSVQNPIGACIIFSKKIFDNLGYFREDLGVGVGDGFYLHEDTEFMRFLQNHQITIKYLPQIKIYHPVPEARMSKSYIRNWYLKSAFSFYYLSQKQRTGYYPDEREPNHFPGIPAKLSKFMPQFLKNIKLCDIPLYLFLKYLSLVLIYPLFLISFNSSLIFYHSILLSKTVGEIKAAKFIL